MFLYHLAQSQSYVLTLVQTWCLPFHWHMNRQKVTLWNVCHAIHWTTNWSITGWLGWLMVKLEWYKQVAASSHILSLWLRMDFCQITCREYVEHGTPSPSTIWRIRMAKNGLTHNGKCSNTRAIQHSSCQLWLSSGLILSSVRPVATQSYTRAWRIITWRLVFSLKRVLQLYSATAQDWTRAYACTHSGGLGGWLHCHLACQYLFTMKSASTSCVDDQAVGLNERHTINAMNLCWCYVCIYYSVAEILTCCWRQQVKCAIWMKAVSSWTQRLSIIYGL